MKDKEKQIEEIAWVIQNDCNNGSCNNVCEFYHNKTFKKVFDKRLECDNIAKAKTIYNLGYQKIDKDSVVLSREEYEKLKKFEWRVTSGVCMTQKEWFDFCNEDSNRRTCLRIEEREKERKETAEKILKEVAKTCGDYQWFKNLCKQFGVEIKE